MPVQETVEITFMFYPPKFENNALGRPECTIVAIGYGLNRNSEMTGIILEELDRYDRIPQEIRKLTNASYFDGDTWIHFLPPVVWSCMYYLFLKHNIKIVPSKHNPDLDPIDFLLNHKPFSTTINCPNHYDTRLAWEILEKQRDLESSEKFAVDWEKSLKESIEFYTEIKDEKSVEERRKTLTTNLLEYMEFIRSSRNTIANMKAHLDRQLKGSGTVDPENKPKEWVDLENEMSKWTKRLPALTAETKKLVDEE